MDSSKHKLRRVIIIMLKEYIKKKSGGKHDCYARVIGFVTGIPREGIPNFIQHEDFNSAVDCYLYAWDLKMAVYDPEIHSDIEEVLHFGFNNSGVMHAVVCDPAGNLLYDSYPKGGSLVKDVEKRVILPVNLLVNMNEVSDGC